MVELLTGEPPATLNLVPCASPAASGAAQVPPPSGAKERWLSVSEEVRTLILRLLATVSLFLSPSPSSLLAATVSSFLFSFSLSDAVTSSGSEPAPYCS
jgi:hypothetical protein